MLYTNYKQIAEITLNSQDAESKDLITNSIKNTVGGEAYCNANGDRVYNETTALPLIAPANINDSVPFANKYRFKVNLLNPMSPNTRIAVKSFVHFNNLQSGNTAGAWDKMDRTIGNIYIDNLYDKNSYNSDPIVRNKFHLMNFPLCYKKVEEYYNDDIINSSKSIQNTAFMNNYFDIVIDAKIKNGAGTEVNGLPDKSKWSLTLIVYDTVMEENPKAFSNGILPILPPKY